MDQRRLSDDQNMLRWFRTSDTPRISESTNLRIGFDRRARQYLLPFSKSR